jgi:2-dehydrotetronate isomerase
MAGKIPPGLEREVLEPTYLANLRWAAKQAHPLGIHILIEPINQPARNLLRNRRTEFEGSDGFVALPNR